MPAPRQLALVLTARPGSGDLTETGTRAARTALDSETVSHERWLADGEAWEATITSQTPETDATRLRAAVGAALGKAPLDINVVPADPATRRKMLLVSDMDSTIIEQECIDEMADVVGLKPRIAAITERAMRGELDFEAALRERLGLLAGVTENDLARVLAERITLMPGARTLTATMRANGARTVLVSGGFSYFTARIAERAGFDRDHANTLEIVDGHLTGNVVGPVLGREAKRETLERCIASLAIQPAQSLAVGDGANDLAMIRMAGLGVAYRAKPVVASEAAASIAHGDLTALLYLQGYAASQFARAE